MDNSRQQVIWTQLTDEIFCGNCKAGQLLIWDRPDKKDHLDSPRDAVQESDYWYVIHCDYFKRRIENPQRLVRCRAHRKRDESAENADETAGEGG